MVGRVLISDFHFELRKVLQGYEEEESIVFFCSFIFLKPKREIKYVLWIQLLFIFVTKSISGNRKYFSTEENNLRENFSSLLN